MGMVSSNLEGQPTESSLYPKDTTLIAIVQGSIHSTNTYTNNNNSWKHAIHYKGII